MKRRTAAILASLFLAGAALAQEAAYPSRPIRMVLPYAAGGGLDAVTRYVAKEMSEDLGQPIVIENKPGAGGMIGAEAVAKAAPDGYTLLMSGNPEILINPTLLAPARYDVARDFIPIMLVSESANILAAHPSVKGTLAEILNKPGTSVSIGSPGLGSPQHLAIEILRASSKANIVHVPYKGAGPAVLDTVGGQVQMTLVGAPPLMPQFKADKLRPLAVTQAQRSRLAPDIPTVEQAAGIKGMDMYRTWYGLLAPTGTPQPIVERVQKSIAGVLARPDVRSRLAEMGTEVVAMPGPALRNLIQSETARYDEVIKRFNIKVN